MCGGTGDAKRPKDLGIPWCLDMLMAKRELLPTNRFIGTVFFTRSHVYVLLCGICFSDSLHSVTGSRFIHLTTADSGIEEPICRTGMETQTQRRDLGTQRLKERVWGELRK